MAVDLKFVLTGAKRVVDARPMYAQVVVTDDCNLTCSYCDEYTPGAPVIPLETLKARIDKLDELGVLVYDFLGGETLLHPQIADLVRHVKSKRGGSNLATIITNAFLLTRRGVEELNEAGLDFMQVSVDTLRPTDWSDKSLKSVLPKLKLLAETAKFQVEIQSVLNEENLNNYDEFRATLKDLPFAFGFSIMHGQGGQIAIRGEKYLSLLEKYGVFEGVNFYGEHLKEMLQGDFSRPWKCLGGFKFLYVTSTGAVQWCAQQRGVAYDLMSATPERLKANNVHKPCEAGCSLGCVRMVSHTLGEPLKTCGASVKLALGMNAPKKCATSTPAAALPLAALLLLAGTPSQAAKTGSTLPLPGYTAESTSSHIGLAPDARFPSASGLFGDDEDPLRRITAGDGELRDAVASAPSLPAPSVIALSAGLRSPSELERLAAVRSAARPLRHETVPYLTAAMLRLSEPERVRAAAALALGRVGSPLAATPLMEALKDPMPSVRYAAALSLGRVSGDGVSTRLEKAVRLDPAWEVRYAAVISLGRSRKTFAVPSLSSALNFDRSWQVRQQAARSLQELGTPAAAEALLPALHDSEPSVRAAAGTALAEIGNADQLQALNGALRTELNITVRRVLALAAQRAAQRLR